MSFKRKKTNGGVAGLAKRVKKSGFVDVGVIGAGKHSESGLTVATVAFQNEFGVGVPERSFFRSALSENKKDIINLQAKLLKQVQSGEMSVQKALGLIGRFTADLITGKIVSLKSPANKQSTINKKGSSNPLIDTGQLRDSITWEVNA